MLQEEQWSIDGYCKWCGSPRYTHPSLGVRWKDGGFGCRHELDSEPSSSMEDYLGIEDR
jgi:hypothetical protein